MIERAAALHTPTAAIVSLFPMPGESPVRQIAEHELPAFEISSTPRRDEIHPDRIEWVPFGSDRPPPTVSVLRSEKSCRAKIAVANQLAIAIAFGGLGAPLPQPGCFCGRRTCSISVELILSGQVPWLNWAKLIHDLYMRSGPSRSAFPTRNGPTVKTCGAAGHQIPKVDLVGDVRGVDRASCGGNRQRVQFEAGCSQRRPASHTHRRGEGATSQIRRSPALCGAIDTFPRKDWQAALSICSINVSGWSPGFSAEMKSSLAADQSQAPRTGLNSSTGCSSFANATRSHIRLAARWPRLSSRRCNQGSPRRCRLEKSAGLAQSRGLGSIREGHISISCTISRTPQKPTPTIGLPLRWCLFQDGSEANG